MCSHRNARSSPTINGDGDDDASANDNLLNAIRPTDLLAAVSQEGHDERADHRAKDTTFAAR
jgi:hypothetical protein